MSILKNCRFLATTYTFHQPVRPSLKNNLSRTLKNLNVINSRVSFGKDSIFQSNQYIYKYFLTFYKRAINVLFIP